MPLLVAQSLVEYSGLSSNSTVVGTVGTAVSSLWEGLSRVDQSTWLTLGGGLLVFAYLTRRRARR